MIYFYRDILINLITTNEINLMNEETYKNFVNYSSFEKHDVPNKEYFAKLIDSLESEVLELKARVKDFPDIPGYKSEIGDVLWYITALANHINIDINEVREYNAKKLNNRHDLGIKWLTENNN